MEEGGLASSENPPADPLSQRLGVTPPPELGAGADRADLGVAGQAHPLARHRHQLAPLAQLHVAPHAAGVRLEGAGLGQLDEGLHLGGISLAQGLTFERGNGNCVQPLADHLHDSH